MIQYNMCIFLYRRFRRLDFFLKIIDIRPLKIKTFKISSKISFEEKKIGRMTLCMQICIFSLKFNNI